MIPRLLLLVTLIALLVLILRRGDDDGLAGDRAEATSDGTGYYLRDALVREYGEDGAVRLEVATRAATQQLATGAIRLEEVSVNYFALPGQRWRLTADGGLAQPDMNSVELEGNVVMTGGRQSLPEPAVLRTDRLTLDTAARLARTESPVTLGFGRHELAATGMQADLMAETLRLESRVNGRFNP
jgi:LPS export ABC transporter protein LptC